LGSCLKVGIADAELLRRFEVLHPGSGRQQSRRLKSIHAMLARNGPKRKGGGGNNGR